MFYVVAFDISDDKKRYRCAKALKGLGTRVQKSVFECPNLSERRFLKLKTAIEKIIDHTTDTVRYYRLCGDCLDKVEVSGTGSQPDNSDVHVV
ncbi:MAG TPA: CRISPR-associated endonuclease Cas2 [Dissulfuribacter thermophilus]|uniref:CRISPR-associated endoribonuclease Cas2 n=1 Tax=Dissulfuribacter thermophilus TaxID=1156395 RepID=A0A7V2WT00_9BACT|nr:CRISPR-associated endonuclease Cas2 [Dissulfuribacter thermophilus]